MSSSVLPSVQRITVTVFGKKVNVIVTTTMEGRRFKPTPESVPECDNDEEAITWGKAFLEAIAHARKNIKPN